MSDPKKYAVHSIFYTIQGEGAHAGRPFVFVRFSGCNVWSGMEKDRERDGERNSKCALICDTQFVGVDLANGGGMLTDEEIRAKVFALWPDKGPLREPRVVFTGGEPSLQLDEGLRRTINACYVAVETNGSRQLPTGIDWITLSPKPPVPVVLHPKCVHEVKVLYPLYNPLDFAAYGSPMRRYVQPVDHALVPSERLTLAGIPCVPNPDTRRAGAEFVRSNPEWRLSLQMHKYLGIP